MVILRILFILFFFAINAESASVYINAGCASECDGSTWAKGWASFGAVTWTRGNTYYVAGGTYTETVTITKAESGESWITIKKANATDNSGDDGWNAAYATDQAVINGKIVINNSYIEIDGVTGSGDSGHGIKIYNAATTGYAVQVVPSKSFVHLHHLEILGAGFDEATDFRGVYQNSVDAVKGFHWSYLYIHEITTNGTTVGNVVGTSWEDYGLLFENNYTIRTGGCTDVGRHGQAMQISYAGLSTYFLIRNNIFKDTKGSAVIAYLGGAATHTYSRIYNNLIYVTDSGTYYNSPGVIWTNSNGGASADFFYIYNNTIYGTTLSQVVLQSTAAITTAELKNNLWVNSNFTTNHVGITTASNNDYYNNTGAGVPVGETGQQTETASPFVNAAGSDFRLVSGSNAKSNGLDLSTVFTSDIAGNTRSVPWSIGAFEYQSGNFGLGSGPAITLGAGPNITLN